MHPTEAYAVAYTRWKERPDELTEQDVAALATFSAANAEEARRLRTTQMQQSAAFRKYPTQEDSMLGMSPDDFADAIADAIRTACAPLVARIAALEQRARELETRQVKYSGVWTGTQHYRVGEMVSHAGSLWHCETANNGMRPGQSFGAWKLAVKKGADGKDAI